MIHKSVLIPVVKELKTTTCASNFCCRVGRDAPVIEPPTEDETVFVSDEEPDEKRAAIKELDAGENLYSE